MKAFLKYQETDFDSRFDSWKSPDPVELQTRQQKSSIEDQSLKVKDRMAVQFEKKNLFHCFF